MDEEPMNEEPFPYNPPSGLWVSTLEDADELEITLNSGKALSRCTIVRADRDALLVATKTLRGDDRETLLIPTSSISHIKLKADRRLGKAIAAAMDSKQPRPDR